MNVIVGFEYSGIVADAFRSRGHKVISCDLLPSESKNKLSRDLHYTGDIFDLLPGDYDIGIFFPPCTFLARVQAHLLKCPLRYEKHLKAIETVRWLWAQPIKQIAIE